MGDLILDTSFQTIDMNFVFTDISAQIEVGQNKSLPNFGPYLPIFSGSFNNIIYENLDFYSDSIACTTY